MIFGDDFYADWRPFPRTMHVALANTVQHGALKANRKPLLWLGPGVPDSEVALALGCLLGKVFGGFGGFWRVWRVLKGLGFWRVWRILERLEGFGGFGVFAGWQTAALKANRKPLLWPWPWGA